MTRQQRQASDAQIGVRICLRTLLPLAAVLLISACELPEEAIPFGEPTVVVHAVMRPDEERQFIVVERSLVGILDESKTVGAYVPNEAAAGDPEEGAEVIVTNVDDTTTSCSNPVRFYENTPHPQIGFRPGVYWAPFGCPVMNPGDSLQLRVVTSEGDTVLGVTEVPGIKSAHLQTAEDSIVFGFGDRTWFNRDRDTIRVAVEPFVGRMLHLEATRIGELDYFRGEDLEPSGKIFADTTTVDIPGSVRDLFAGGEGNHMFRAGRHYTLIVGITDRNYFDFARSRSNSYTGRGFINHLRGGIGVFGAMDATTTRVSTTGDFDDPREGVYRLQGVVADVDVDAEMTVYFAHSQDSTEFSGFVSGDWFNKPRYRPWATWYVESLGMEGKFEGDDMYAMVRFVTNEARAARVVRFLLSGTRNASDSFTLSVADSTSIGNVPMGTLTATKQPESR